MKKLPKILGFVYPICLAIMGCNSPLFIHIDPRPSFNPEGFLAVKPNTVKANALVLQWKQVDYAASYILRCYEESGKSDRRDETKEIEYSIENLQANTEYVFIIKAINSTGRESEGSKELRQRTLLSTPKNLAVPTAAETEIRLKWDPVAGADQYELYYNTDSIWDPNKSYITSQPEYAFTGLRLNTQYFFWVMATNNAENWSDFSDPLEQFTLAVPPEEVIAAVLSAASVRVFWLPVPGIETYTIYRAAGSSENFDILKSDFKGTFYQDSGLSPGTLYTYYVTSVNPSGESAPSSSVSATTYAAPSITVTVNPITDIEVTPQRIVIPKPESKIFEAPDNYTQYAWYLDGDPRGNTPSYTLETSSMTAGVYTLTVVVETSQGEKRSGSYRITITN